MHVSTQCPVLLSYITVTSCVPLKVNAAILFQDGLFQGGLVYELLQYCFVHEISFVGVDNMLSCWC